MADYAYSPKARKAAFQALQVRYPSLFPAAHVTPGVEHYAMDGDSKRSHLDDIWPQAPVSYMTQFFDKIFTLWPTAYATDRTRFLNSSVDTGFMIIEKYPIEISAVTLKDPDLITLADGRNKGVIKSIPYTPDKLTRTARGFNIDIIISRLLNILVTGYAYTATPHFATFLGCFKGAKGLRVYSMYERGDYTLTAVKTDDWSFEHMGCFLFQIIFSFAVAASTMGYEHGDPHPDNIMIREVTDTRYYNRTWAYKLRGVDKFVYIDPAIHQNKMIEIIDQGGAEIDSHAPDSPESTHRLRFARDVRSVLGSCDFREKGKNPELAERFFQFWFRLPARVNESSDKERASLPLLDLWHTDDAQHGLGFLFASFMNKKPVGVPLVVAIAPNDTILATGDPMITDLPRLWNVRQGMKRTRDYDACRTCGSKPRFATADAHAHPFCGRDCYHVFYGVMDIA